MVARLVLLVTTPRVPAGMLTHEAWAALRSGVVMTRDQDHPQRDALAAAGIVTEAVDPEHPPVAIARILLTAAREGGSAVWLAGSGGDDDVAHALAEQGVQAAERGEQVDLEVVYGSWDPPGARLLDVVTTMDRLRSPGGCPWDAQQTHDSLAPYLLEEAYEAFQAIEDGDGPALRDELGDVLLQVAFHARVAAEAADGRRFDIDDVAGDLVDKLVRRHPHVFGDAGPRDVEQVEAGWEEIKKAEKQRRSPTEGVSRSQPAASWGAALVRRAGRAGLPVPSAAELSDASPEALGERLLAVVTAAEQRGWDVEDALREAVRRYAGELDAAAHARP